MVAAYQLKYGVQPAFTDKKPATVCIEAMFGIPKSFSKAKRADALSGRIYPTKKPDADNIAKIVLDALNGVAYTDDTQVINLLVQKRYGKVPEVKVEITEVNNG